MQGAKKVRNKSNQQKTVEKKKTNRDNFQAWQIKQMTLAIVEIAPD